MRDLGNIIGNNRRALTLLLIIGAIVRCAALGKQSLWLDEMTSIEVASRSISDILAGVGFDRHTPPFYYILLHGWFQIWAINEVSLRFFSVCFDVLNIALIFQIFTSQFGNRAGRLTTLLYSLSPFAVYYAQEGRMYTLLVSLVLATYYLALRVRSGLGSIGERIVLILVGVLGCYTHYYYLLCLSGISIGLLVSGDLKKRLLDWILPLTVVGIIYLPWVRIVISLAATGGQAFRKFLISVLPYTFFRFSAGYAVVPIREGIKQNLAATAASNLVPLLAWGGIFLILFIIGLRALMRENYPETRLFVAAFFIPIFAATVVSAKIPMLSERYLISVFPYFLAIIALGCLALPNKRQLGQVLAISLSCLGLAEYFASPQFGKTQWRDAAQIIVSEDKNPYVFVSPEYNRGVLGYYLPKETKLFDSRNLDLPPTIFSGSASLWVVESVDHPSEVTLLEKLGNATATSQMVTVDLPFENGLHVTRYKFSGTPLS